MRQNVCCSFLYAIEPTSRRWQNDLSHRHFFLAGSLFLTWSCIPHSQYLGLFRHNVRYCMPVTIGIAKVLLIFHIRSYRSQNTINNTRNFSTASAFLSDVQGSERLCENLHIPFYCCLHKEQLPWKVIHSMGKPKSFHLPFQCPAVQFIIFMVALGGQWYGSGGRISLL